MEHLSESNLLLLIAALVVCGVTGGLLLNAYNTGRERSPFRKHRESGEPVAHIVKRSESMGLGCLLQLLGVVALVCGVFALSPLVGLIGLCVVLIGGRKARWLQCSDCTGRIAEETARICPHCRSRLG